MPVLEKFDHSWRLRVTSWYNSSRAKMSVQRSFFGFNFSLQRSLIVFNFPLQRSSCALLDPRASDRKNSQEVAVLMIHTWYTRIADENENRAYRANWYDHTQNRFEYWQKRSIGTRLVSFLSRRVSRETRCDSREGGNLLLSGTVT